MKWVSTLEKSGSQFRSLLSKPSSGVHVIVVVVFVVVVIVAVIVILLLLFVLWDWKVSLSLALFSAALNHTLPPWLRHVSETGTLL